MSTVIDRQQVKTLVAHGAQLIEVLPAEEYAEDGPTTFRPSKALEALTERMQRRQVGTVLITDPEGVLIGVLYQDAERRLNE